jgi:hypothetical protein
MRKSGISAQKMRIDSPGASFDPVFAIFGSAASQDVTQKAHGVTQKPAPLNNQGFRPAWR